MYKANSYFDIETVMLSRQNQINEESKTSARASFKVLIEFKPYIEMSLIFHLVLHLMLLPIKQ